MHAHSKLHNAIPQIFQQPAETPSATIPLQLPADGTRDNGRCIHHPADCGTRPERANDRAQTHTIARKFEFGISHKTPPPYQDSGDSESGLEFRN